MSQTKTKSTTPTSKLAPARRRARAPKATTARRVATAGVPDARRVRAKNRRERNAAAAVQFRPLVERLMRWASANEANWTARRAVKLHLEIESRWTTPAHRAAMLVSAAYSVTREINLDLGNKADKLATMTPFERDEHEKGVLFAMQLALDLMTAGITEQKTAAADDAKQIIHNAERAT